MTTVPDFERAIDLWKLDYMFAVKSLDESIGNVKVYQIQGEQ